MQEKKGVMSAKNVVYASLVTAVLGALIAVPITSLKSWVFDVCGAPTSSEECARKRTEARNVFIVSVCVIIALLVAVIVRKRASAKSPLSGQTAGDTDDAVFKSPKNKLFPPSRVKKVQSA